MCIARSAHKMIVKMKTRSIGFERSDTAAYIRKVVRKSDVVIITK